MRIGILEPVHPVLTSRLEAAGHLCIPLHALPSGGMHAALPTLEGIVLRSAALDAATIDRSPLLRVIARVGSGLENIDTAHCRRRNVIVLNSPEGNRDGVGECCVLLLLGLMRHLVQAHSAVRAGLWPREELRGTDLRGKTVGIIGFGQMGSAFAEKLRGFGVRILAHDKYRSGFGRAGIEECTLERLFKESDVISLHLPLSAETGHFADEAFFQRPTRPVWFLNTSRGGVVHTRALLDALDEGRVIAAGLDVLEFERPALDGLDTSIDQASYDRLMRHERVLLTPHIAGVTHEGRVKMAGVLATKILHLFPHATT